MTILQLECLSYKKRDHTMVAGMRVVLPRIFEFEGCGTEPFVEVRLAGRRPRLLCASMATNPLVELMKYTSRWSATVQVDQVNGR